MTRQISYWCQQLLNSWLTATPTDYLFVVAWVVLVGYLISKVTSFTPR